MWNQKSLVVGLVGCQFVETALNWVNDDDDKIVINDNDNSNDNELIIKEKAVSTLEFLW